MPSQDGRVGFGIIGLGYGLSRLPLIRQVPEAHLVAVAARTEEKARAAAAEHACDWYTDYRRMLEREDVDVVGIYTPPGQHLEIAIDAARAGKHVLSTKPLEVTLERLDAIVNACRAADVKLATEFVVRYAPANYALYRAVQDGKLGTMILGEFAEKLYRPQWYYESDSGWRGTWAIGGGGVMVNQAIHTIDQMLWLMGDVASVSARYGTYTIQTETEDTAVAMIAFRSGALGVVVGTTTFHNDRPPGRYGGGTTRRIEINGDLGSATLIDDRIVMAKAVGDGELPLEVAPPALNAIQDFARWIEDDDYSSPTLVTAEESRKSMEVVLAIYESARRGETVTLPLGAG